MNTVTLGCYWRITTEVGEGYNIDQPKCPVCLENNFLEMPRGIAHNISHNDTTTHVEQVWHKICLKCFMSLYSSSRHGLHVQCPVCRFVGPFYSNAIANAPSKEMNS